MGKYPVKCVEILSRITSINRTEPWSSVRQRFGALENDHAEIASAAVKLAESIQAKAIIVPTRRGKDGQLRDQLPSADSDYLRLY